MKKIKCATVSHVHAMQIFLTSTFDRKPRRGRVREWEREKMEKKEEVFEVMAIFSVFRNLTE